MATSIIMMAFFFTMPMSRMMPMNAITENGVPKMSSARVAPITGGRQRRENGDRMDGVLVENAEHDVDGAECRQQQQRQASPSILREDLTRAGRTAVDGGRHAEILHRLVDGRLRLAQASRRAAG